jgi:acetylornithine deacetylase/succinyl-diaminopimelate desuccinylase-like protein
VLRDLEEWLAIPSISADPARTGDVRRAGDWLATRLRHAGGKVSMLATNRAHAPVVVGRFGSARRGGPLLVVYGHYDVQPPGPGWTSSPFRPQRRGDRLVARGASDDKGQLMAHVAAIEAWQEVGGPPIDIMVVAEGAEEIGSPGLAAALRPVTELTRSSRRPVAVVVSDTRRASRALPSITVSQRGMLSLDVVLDVGGPPVHAGRFGGAVTDPGPLLGCVLYRAAAALAAVPVAVLSPGRTVTTASDAAVRSLAGDRAVVGIRLSERTTERAALSVTSLSSGGAGGAVPASATARVDVRLPPGVEPSHVQPVLTRLVARSLPRDVRVTVIARDAVRGLAMRPSPVWLDAIEASCTTGFGGMPRYVRSGGTIGAVAVLADVFGVTPLLLGLGPPDDGAHGPDEYMDVSGWTRSVDTCVVLAQNFERMLVRIGHRSDSLSGSHVAKANDYAPDSRLDGGRPA